MKTELLIALAIIIVIIACVCCNGCMVIWSDDVFIGTMFKSVDANNLEFISEPNLLQICSGNSRTDNDEIKAGAIVGGVPISIESNN